jgi:ATP-dependent DNA ligase
MHPRDSLAGLPNREASFIDPMECLPVTKLPDGLEWTFEIKLDGYRALVVKSQDKVSLYSRRKKSFNSQYPYLIEALSDLPDGTVVDGEIVSLDDSGPPNFHLLQQFRSQASRIHYFIFDLLICEHRDLTGLPLSERRKRMREFVKPNSRIHFSEQFEVSASKVLAAVRAQKLEGVVAKRKDSVYEPGKRTSR